MTLHGPECVKPSVFEMNFELYDLTGSARRLRMMSMACF
jgi:hypothetical protein